MIRYPLVATLIISVNLAGCLDSNHQFHEENESAVVWSPHEECPEHPFWQHDSAPPFHQAWLHSRQGNWKTEHRHLVGVTALWGPAELNAKNATPTAWVFSSYADTDVLSSRMITAYDKGKWESKGAWSPRPEAIETDHIKLLPSALDWIDFHAESIPSHCAIRSMNLVLWDSQPVWGAAVFDRRQGTSETSFWNATSGEQINRNDYPGLTFFQANDLLMEAYPKQAWRDGHVHLISSAAHESLYPGTGVGPAFLGGGSIPSIPNAFEQDGHSQSWYFEITGTPGSMPRGYAVMADGRVLRHIQTSIFACGMPPCFPEENPVTKTPIDSPEAVAKAVEEQELVDGLIHYSLRGPFSRYSSNSTWHLNHATIFPSISVSAEGGG